MLRFVPPVLAILLALALVRPGAAFEFDGWRSGMGLAEILEMARARDLAVAPSSFAHEGRHYDPRIAARGAGTHRSYAYPARLRGRPARVTLELGPNGRALHTVVVSWSLRGAEAPDRRRLEAGLVRALTRAYGPSSRPPAGSLGGYLFGDGARLWSPGPDDRVLVETRAGVLQLRCVDLRRKETADREAAGGR